MGRAAPGMLLHRKRRRPERLRRVLIAHHLLLGDTLMLTPLLKKLRERHPDAEIVMTVPRPYALLYAGRPYGVKVLPFDVRSVSDHAAMRSERGFDLALVPGDNRWSWLARMLDASWIIAFAADRQSYKDAPVDELVPMSREPLAWGDIAARLLEGDEPAAYRPEEWPAPPFSPYAEPSGAYAVLHLGASSPHKLWPPERWAALIAWIEQRGYRVVLSTGRGEESLLSPVDPSGARSGLAGKLDLAQLWNLLRNAAFLVCPDTGVAHMGRVVGVPTIALYGPGSPISTGPGRFWSAAPFRPVWDPDVPCRDQDRLFERRLPWVRQCWRTVAECGNPVCIRRVALADVVAAITALVPAPIPRDA